MISLRRSLLSVVGTIAVVISSGSLAASQVAGPRPLPSADPQLLLTEGRALLNQGKRDDADRVLKAAIDAATQSSLAQDDKDRVIGAASLSLASMRQELSRNAEGLVYYQQALTALERLNDDGGIARALVGIVTFGRQPLVDEEKQQHGPALSQPRAARDRARLSAEGIDAA